MTLRLGLFAVIALARALAPAVVSGEQPPPWAGHLETMNAALARGDVSRAVRAWDDSYAAALRSRTWQGLVEVGDAYRQMAEIGSFREPATPMARQIYLRALLRAQAHRSVEGVLRVAAAFDGLGDRAVVEQCMKVAEDVARQQRDAMAMQQIAATRARLALQTARPGTARP